MVLSAANRRATASLREFGAVLVADVRSLPNLWATVLLGGLLWGYAVWLVVPGFLVMGFFVRTLRYVPPSTATEDVTPRPTDPPAFDDWVELLVDGVRAYVIWTAYVLIAFGGSITFFQSEGSSRLLLAILSSMLGDVSFLLRMYTTLVGELTDAGPLVAGVVFDPVLLGVLFAMYVGPAGLLNFAARGSLADGFSFRDLNPILRNPTYARNWVVFVVAWAVGTLVLFLPAHLVATRLVPVAVPTLVVAVRESLELGRGFASFGCFLVGYTALGRVSVPPRTTFSLTEYLQARLDTDAVGFVSRHLRSGQTVLLAALLASFWSLPAVVLLMGYVVAFVRANGDDEPVDVPSFARLGTLVVDGVRAVFLWVAVAVPPLVCLFVWNSHNPWSIAEVGNFLTGSPAFVLGAWYLGRDVYTLLIDVWPAGIPRTPFDPTLGLAGFVVLGVLATYCYPAVVVRLARRRRLRGAVAPRALLEAVGTWEYAVAWVRAMLAFTLGAGLLLLWNAWDLQQTGALGLHTTTLLEVGDFSLFTVPTATGLTSSFFLFLVALGNVLLLFRGYYGIAEAVSESR